MLNGIKPIGAKSMAERVEASLREYFAKGNFKPGDPLPTELELAAALGVSRNVVREALSRFKMLGIIETKKKTGMVISNPDIVGTFEKVLTPRSWTKPPCKTFSNCGWYLKWASRICCLFIKLRKT